MGLEELLKDKTKIDIGDICSAWQWAITDQKTVLLVTCFGDLFLIGPNDEISWLETGSGKLTVVSENLDDFRQQLRNQENIDNWFLPSLYSELKEAGITLKENQVYSYKQFPSLGGEYIFENIEPTDISVHFHLTGQISEQIKDLPPGTKLKIDIEE